MKKILAVSLVAVMAVSTARADIASTAYVQGAVGAEKTLRENADTAIKNSIGTVSSANMGTTASTVVTAIKEHSDALKSVASSGTVSELSGRVTAIEESAYATSGVTSDTVTQVATNKAAIAGMDLAQVGADGSYIKTVKQADGNVTATAEAADTTPTQNSKKMVTSGGVYTALSGKQNNLSETQLAAANSGITSAKVTTYDGYNAKITAAQNTADAKEASENKKNAIEENMTEAQKQVAFPTIYLVEELIDTNTTDLADQVVINKDAIAGMDLAQVGADGSYIKTVKQADGNVTATAEAADTTPTQNSKKMVTSGGVYTALSGKQATLTGTNVKTTGNGTVVTAVEAANGVVTVTKGTTLGSLATKSTVTSAEITNGTIVTDDLANGAVTAAKIGADVVASGNTLTNPTTDGNYVLTLKVVNGALSMGWEAIDRTYQVQ